MTKKKEQAQETTDIQENTEQDNMTKEQLDELTNILQRVQAEFENYKKRTEKEYQSMIKNANADLIRQFLPILDSFELAIKNSNGNAEIEKFKKGLEMIYAQFFSALKEQGLREIDTKNKTFDPYKHEVLMIKEGEEHDIIIEEFQKGYMLNEIVLRHSKVMISKKHKDEEAANNQEKNE